MIHCRKVAVVCMLIMTLAQSSCVESENPLVDPEKCQIDERLFGQWKVVEKDDTSSKSWFFGRPIANEIINCPDGLMVWHQMSFSAKHEIDWERSPAYLFSAKVGKDRYLQLFEHAEWKEKKKMTEWNKAKVKAYAHLKYEIANGELTLWFMDNEASAAAIKAGDLKGTVRKGDAIGGPKVTLTESTQGLCKYLESGGNASLYTDRANALNPPQLLPGP